MDKKWIGFESGSRLWRWLPYDDNFLSFLYACGVWYGKKRVIFDTLWIPRISSNPFPSMCAIIVIVLHNELCHLEMVHLLQFREQLE